MTFTVIDPNGKRYTIDLETLDDLQALADRYGWMPFNINFIDMVITLNA